jgi:L-ascorbate metabolism protein UlaG (beta-lactamase superfamily)
MEITWYGHSCFRLTERGLATTIIDPYNGQALGEEPLRLKGDIVTISHDKPGHNHAATITGNPHVVNGPGEYEVGGVFITGIQTNENRDSGELANVLYLFDYNDLNVAHLGALNRVPSQAEVEDLGPVHILLIPVGGESTLDAARAAEVVSLFDPNIVIPMHYQNPDSTESLDLLNKFLKQMGAAEDHQTLSSLKVNSTAALSEETRIVVLERQSGER